MEWRVIGLESFSADMNMGIDHAIYDSVEGGGPPTIRFYTWEHGAVSVGKGQASSIVNISACKKNVVGMVRRPTGGNLVYHAPQDFTYSVVAPNNLFGSGDGLVNHSAYREICSWIIEALRRVKIRGSLVGAKDVVVDGIKICGNAQKKGDTIFLQHGALFFKSRPAEWAALLSDSLPRLSKLKPISEFGKVNPRVFYQCLLEAFTINKIVDGKFSSAALSNEELRRAHELADTVYTKKNFLGSGNEKKGDVCAIDLR